MLVPSVPPAPVTFSAPLPSAVPVPATIPPPPVRFVPPANELLPFSVSVPVPLAFSAPPPLIAPDSASPVAPSTVRPAPSVTLFRRFTPAVPASSVPPSPTIVPVPSAPPPLTIAMPPVSDASDAVDAPVMFHVPPWTARWVKLSYVSTAMVPFAALPPAVFSCRLSVLLPPRPASTPSPTDDPVIALNVFDAPTAAPSDTLPVTVPPLVNVLPVPARVLGASTIEPLIEPPLTFVKLTCAPPDVVTTCAVGPAEKPSRPVVPIVPAFVMLVVPPAPL
ncbi:hypothetical protein BamIOP4010DRAFT_5877 [Burkholderia ambifaria IOP40-10]|uniref:Uncharacterized protein n=1 Tax=Burkholderia ambifaria IOP40-10 TaxID=396596 RepID=B1FPB6_9BURK|nr:hypothetical protein BamIOP4010DRAFT_5877 [Burkholderia ambifaria IOP40-10]